MQKSGHGEFCIPFGGPRDETHTPSTGLDKTRCRFARGRDDGIGGMRITRGLCYFG